MHDAKTTPRYWCSYLDSSIEAALDMISEDEGTTQAVSAASRHLDRALNEYRSSGVPTGFVGYVVECQKGEVYSLVRTLAEATTMRRYATRYLGEARSSGHSSAPGYVNERLPMAVRPVLADEWSRIRHEGPVLDREP